MATEDIIRDDSVVRDARLMLEKASRILATLENFYFASEADEVRYAKKLSEALANIHAATARLE